MTVNLEKTKELIVNRFWERSLSVEFSARDVFSASLIGMPPSKLSKDILLLSQKKTSSDSDVSNLIQKHMSEIESRLKKSISDFTEFFIQYGGKESVISMCLFGSGSLEPDLGIKVDNMLGWYAREQDKNWSIIHGAIVGHVEIYQGWEALKWFLSSVILTGSLWDISKEIVCKLIISAKNMADIHISNGITETQRRIQLLDLTDQEIDQLSSHWESNFKNYFLSLSFSEKDFINQLSNGPVLLKDIAKAPEELKTNGYICEIEINPGEVSIAFFPHSLHFFNERHNKEKEEIQ